MTTSFSGNPYASPALRHGNTDESSAPGQRNVLLWLVALSGSALPLISYFYVLLFWIVASFMLGEWVRPGVHDPVEFLFGVPHALHVVFMLSSFGVLPLIFVIGYKIGKLRQLLVLYLLSFLTAIVLFRLNVMQISTWIAD